MENVPLKITAPQYIFSDFIPTDAILSVDAREGQDVTSQDVDMRLRKGWTWLVVHFQCFSLFK